MIRPSYDLCGTMSPEAGHLLTFSTKPTAPEHCQTPD